MACDERCLPNDLHIPDMKGELGFPGCGCSWSR